MEGILSRALQATIVVASVPAVLLGFVESNRDPMLDFQRVLRPQLTAPQSTSAYGKQLKVESDSLNGIPRVLSGNFDVQVDGLELAHYEQACLGTLDDLRDHIGSLKKVDLKLDRSQLVFDEQDQFLKYRVYRDALLVKDATFDCRFKAGRLVQIVNMGFLEARADLRSGRANVRKTLLERFSIVEESTDQLRVIEDKKGYRYVRIAQAVVSNGPEVFVAQVDKATGEIFEMVPTQTHLSGGAKAQVYPRSYRDALEDAALAFIKISDKDSTTITHSDRDGLFHSASMARVFLDGYIGQSVQTSPKTGTKVTVDGIEAGAGVWEIHAAADPSAKVSDDRALAHAMVYYHTDKIIQLAKSYITHNWLNQSLIANINLSQTCNAHWDGRTINFYIGDNECANTALISDVIYHEWGHGLDHAAGGIEDGAYSEGFGDIMSLILTQDHLLAKDFFLTGKEIRNLLPKKIYPKDRSSSVHAEGQIIGSTFWNLFTRLKAKHGLDQATILLRQYAFKMIMATSKYTDVYHALLVIDDDDGDLTTPSANYCIINKAFSEHGLAIADADCLLGTIETYRLLDEDRDGILSPGESAELLPNLQNRQNRVLSGVVLTAEISSSVPGVVLTNNRIEIEDIAPLALVRLTEGFGIEVDPSVPCGSRFAITITLQEGSSQESENILIQLSVGRDAGVTQDWMDGGLPMDIPDPGEIKRAFSMTSAQWSDDATSSQIRAKMKIDHNYMGDIFVYLKAPQGSDQLIFRGSGTEKSADVDLDITDLFKGVKIKGDWQLKVRDAYADDVGRLQSFSISVRSADWVCR